MSRHDSLGYVDVDADADADADADVDADASEDEGAFGFTQLYAHSCPSTPYFIGHPTVTHHHVQPDEAALSHGWRQPRDSMFEAWYQGWPGMG